MSDSSQPRIVELDGLRALAVLLVMLCHYGPVALPLLWRVRAVGWIGVDLFFVLSGFLITGILLASVRRPDYFLNFYARRSLRIFPLYYLVLVSIVVVAQVADRGRAYTELVSRWGHPIWFFTYLANVRCAAIGRGPTTFALAPLWSLQVEEQFYLILPVTVWLIGPRSLFKLLLVLVLAAPLLRLVLWYEYPANPLLQYVLLPCRMDGLALGAAIAIRCREPWAIRRGLLMAVTACVWVLAYGTYTYVGGNLWSSPFTRIWGYSLFSIAFAATLLLVLVLRGTWMTRWLAAPPLRYLGKISYGIYLLQAPVATVLAVALSATALWQNEMTRFLTIAATTVLLAAVSWYSIEQPMLRLKRRFGEAVSTPATSLLRTAS
ncbi:MAG: acyltransferase family protein [Steroidobacteraceae bacterium]